MVHCRKPALLLLAYICAAPALAQPVPSPADPDAMCGRADGTRDARAAPDNWQWLACGFFASGLAIYGCTHAALGAAGGPGPHSFLDCNTALLAGEGAALGCIVGLLSPGLAFVVDPAPAPARLLGRSSAYAESYTSAYVRTARRVRTGRALIGWLVGGVAGSVLAAATVFQ